MNSTLNISSAGAVFAVGEAPSISSGTTTSEKSVTGARNFVHTRLSHWRASDILEGVAGVLAVLYLLCTIAFFVALLFHTFSR